MSNKKIYFLYINTLFYASDLFAGLKVLMQHAQELSQ